MTLWSRLFLTTAACAIAIDGMAQQAPTAAPVSEASPVVVTANRLAVQNLIDRKVYTIAADLQSVTGSVSDVLGAIPSVQLDADGNVSLRGDSNVTILIDGRPSAQLQGASVGDVLQQMAANEIERIEVITNPPAQFKAEGTAGVINIVTRRARADGGSGTVQANIGNHHRGSTTGSGSYKKGAFALTGSVGLRLEDRIRTLHDHRVVADPTGAVVTTIDRAQSEEVKRLLPSVRGTLEWKPDARRTVSLSASESQRRGRGRHFEETDQTIVAGAITGIATRVSDGTESGLDSGQTLTYEQTTTRKDEKFTVSVGQTRFHETEHYYYSNAIVLPPTLLLGDGYGFSNDYSKRLANVDYARPLAMNRSVKVGYAYEASQNVYDTNGQLQVVTNDWQDNPVLANHFQYRQTLQSLYGSYQQEQAGWTALAGLRVEDARVRIASYDGQVPAPTADTKVFPSLHLEHPMGALATISLNVGRRIARPDPESLDPHINREDIHNLSGGNPALRPQTTNAYELGYAVEGPVHSYALNGYWRDIRDAYTEIVQVIDASTVLATRSNLDHAHSGGLELTANGRLWSRLSYNLSGNWKYSAVAFPGLPTQSAVSLSAKLSVDYKANPTDTWQVAYAKYGKWITPQGSWEPTGAVNLGYKHVIDERLSAVVTVTDIFNSQAWRRYTNTTDLAEVYERRRLGRLISIGFSYQIGRGAKKTKHDGAFDYDAGG